MREIAILLLLLIEHVFDQPIRVEFNTTFRLDSSIVTWLSSAGVQCTVSTAETSMTTELETSPTQQSELSAISTSVTEVYLTTAGIISRSTASTQTQTTIQSPVQPVDSYTCLDGSYGAYCNISSDVCTIAYPCLNGGSCSLNTTQSAGYSCQCPSGFTGDGCENDQRICAANTCWNNGTCLEINQTVSGNNITTFDCQCLLGYDGLNCQASSDMCANITCENEAICKSSYLTWSCQCLDASLYSGTYCEVKSSTLKTKEALSKSFAIIAIIFISIVAAFVVLMDVLKYVFNIDPVDRERHRLRVEKEKQEQKRFQKKKPKNVYLISSYAR